MRTISKTLGAPDGSRLPKVMAQAKPPHKGTAPSLDFALVEVLLRAKTALQPYAKTSLVGHAFDPEENRHIVSLTFVVEPENLGPAQNVLTSLLLTEQVLATDEASLAISVTDIALPC